MIAAPYFLGVLGFAFATQGLTLWLLVRELRPLIRAVVAANGKELAVLDKVAQGGPVRWKAPARPHVADEFEDDFVDRPRPIGL